MKTGINHQQREFWDKKMKKMKHCKRGFVKGMACIPKIR